MVGGLARGLDHEDAAQLLVPAGDPGDPRRRRPEAAHAGRPGRRRHPRQVVVGALVAGVAAYLSVRFLTRYFETRTLTPFAIYCLVAGVACIIRFS